MFDLFPNDLDMGVSELEGITTSNRESERPESGGGFVGLMAKLLDTNRRDENSGGGNEEVCEIASTDVLTYGRC